MQLNRREPQTRIANVPKCVRRDVIADLLNFVDSHYPLFPGIRHPGSLYLWEVSATVSSSEVPGKL